MSRLNSRSKGTLLNYAALFINHGANLLIMPFLIRQLGYSQYGLYVLVCSAISILLLMDLGLSSSIVKFVSINRVNNDREGENTFYSSIFFLYCIIAGVLCILCGLLARWLPVLYQATLSSEEQALLRLLCLIMTGNVLFTSIGNAFNAILSAYERFAFQRMIDIGGYILRYGLISLCLFMDCTVQAVMIADVLACITLNTVKSFYAVQTAAVRIRFHMIKKETIRKVLGYSRFVFLATVAGQIYWKIDHLILGMIGNTLWVTINAIGTQITLVFIAFSSAIANVFFPKIVGMVENHATREELTAQMVRTGRIQAMVIGILLCGFLFFGRKFIILWAGEDYVQAYWIATAIALPLSVLVVQNLGIYILQAMNRHWFRSIMMLGMAMVNVGLTIVFVDLWGVVGAGIATGIGLLLGNVVVLNIYYSRAIGLRMGLFYRELIRGIGPALMICACAGFGLYRWTPAVSWTSLLTQVMLFSVLYIALMWFIGMNTREKKYISDILDSVRKKTAALITGRCKEAESLKEYETVEERVGRDHCSGCTACLHACPAHCIEMKIDREGFAFPRVDRTRCIQCSACVRVCPMIREPESHSVKAYAGWHRGNDLRALSSSGGVFSALASAVLAEGGCVCGVIMDEHLRCRHVLADSEQDLAAMRGSKYMQSELGDVFPRIKDILETGQTVLFSGTPCQIAGLHGYLTRDYASLCTVDLVCHGVPPAKVFLSYIQDLQQAMGKKITSYRFRDSRQGWEEITVCMGFEDGTEKIISFRDDSFFRGFSFNLFLRPSCYRCHIRGACARSDLTLGDFWGIRHIDPSLYSDQGVSLVLCHTAKGAAWLEKAASWLALYPGTLEEAAAYNPNLVRPPVAAKSRETFFRIYFRHGYKEAKHRYLLPPPTWQRRMYAIYCSIRNILLGRWLSSDKQ